jgi:hypothetical protein
VVGLAYQVSPRFRITIPVEIHPSARKHGIADEDIEHAMKHPLAIDDQDGDTRLYLGPARSVELLEVVTIVRDDGSELAIHANEDAAQVPRAATGRLTMARKKTYGRTAGGKPITDELVEQLADEAETGYDVDETLRRRGGRPPIGSAAASVESVRLDPELRQALAQRAARDHETTSSVIRKALRKYLQVG